MEQSETRQPDEARASRRSFLRLAGLSLTAGAAGLAGCAAPAPQVVDRPVEVTREVTRQVEVAKAAPDLPWQYVALDVEQARKYGHIGYYEMECCSGTFSGVLRLLQEKVGAPYTQIPARMLRFGQGGLVGWGTTCGTLVGAAAAITLALPFDDAKKVIDDLMAWYTRTPFPSETANRYATEHLYLVKEYKSDKALPQSVSNSPLCHASVSRWCQASGFASGAPERAERCGRLSGDVAAHAVELMNAYSAKQFSPVAYKPSAESQTCTTCHTAGTDFKAGNFTLGKGECVECHDPHPLTK
jgi:hypothetical protein